MRKVVWFGLVILQELKMLKFKSLFRYLYDSRYRKDINNLSNLLSPLKLTSEVNYLALSQIRFSHDITYPTWVLRLVRDIDNGVPMNPIKVIYDPKAESYIVVDGNHRLMAHKLSHPHKAMIPVRILFPAEQSAEESRGA